MAEFPTFRGSWPWPWRWIGSYTVMHHSSTSTYIPNWNRRNFLWTDGRTDGLWRPIY